MQLYPSGLFSVFLFVAMILFPKAVFNGAAEGLLLWFQIVFPTLFPFMVITNLILATGGLDTVARIVARPFYVIFRVSEAGAFAVLAGFLCGYPMGAKVTADLLHSGRISREEGQYLLSFCNNASPVFILNYIVWKTFETDRLAVPTLLILTGTSVLMSFLFRNMYAIDNIKRSKKSYTNAAHKKMVDFSVLDMSMMDSFEAIVKVGGYIILFSVLTALFEILPGNSFIRFFLPFLEVTNGILLIRQNVDLLTVSYPWIIALTAFGGLCAAAQTKCMIRNTGIPLFPYFLQKIVGAVVAGILAYLCIRIVPV